MKEIPLPASDGARLKIKNSLRRQSVFWNVAFYLFTALAVVGLIGLVVAVILSEFRKDMGGVLIGALLGGFAGGCVLGTVGALLSARCIRGTDEKRLDFSERCDSPESFYVGEGTLATFAEKELVLHGEERSSKAIRIPYAETKFYSVCVRRAPRERGEWSIVIGLPACYLAKDGGKGSRELVYVQTDDKPRLVDTIAARGLTLLGEKRGDGKGKFTLKAKYYLPIPAKRRRAILIAAVGGAVAIAGVPVAIWLETGIGSILTVLGLVAAGRGMMSFAGGKNAVLVYEEGIFYRPGGIATSEEGGRMFLKWEEIERLSRETVRDADVIKVQCPYGVYHLPAVGDLFEYLKTLHPEKF